MLECCDTVAAGSADAPVSASAAVVLARGSEAEEAADARGSVCACVCIEVTGGAVSGPADTADAFAAAEKRGRGGNGSEEYD